MYWWVLQFDIRKSSNFLLGVAIQPCNPVVQTWRSIWACIPEIKGARDIEKLSRSIWLMFCQIPENKWSDDIKESNPVGGRGKKRQYLSQNSSVSAKMTAFFPRSLDFLSRGVFLRSSPGLLTSFSAINGGSNSTSAGTKWVLAAFSLPEDEDTELPPNSTREICKSASLMKS